MLSHQLTHSPTSPLTEADAAELPRRLNATAHVGRWVALPQSSTLRCDGRLFETSVRVELRRIGWLRWSASVVRTPKAWNDPLSLTPFVDIEGDNPVDTFKAAVEAARSTLECQQ